MKVLCKGCNKKIHVRKKTNELIRGKVLEFKHIPTNKTYKLIAFKEYCKKCAKLMYKNWCIDNNILYNKSFKKQFWITMFPEYKNIIETRENGKGSYEHYKNIGYTEKDWKEKNSHLSVNYDTLKKKYGSKKAIEIRAKHLKNCIITKDDYINKYGKIEGEKRYALMIKNKTINSIRRVEYWMKKGYSYDESIIMVSKIQSRNVDFYINKYGESEGKKKFANIYGFSSYEEMMDNRTKPYLPIFYNKTYRRQIFMEQKYKCVLCNSINAKRYDLHHIDHDKNNNQRDNLIFLCIKCHSKETMSYKKNNTYIKKKLTKLNKEIINESNNKTKNN